YALCSANTTSGPSRERSLVSLWTPRDPTEMRSPRNLRSTGVTRGRRRASFGSYYGHLLRGPGRPRVTAEICQWVVRMATDNPSWGYPRIQGALANLTSQISRGTIAT